MRQRIDIRGVIIPNDYKDVYDWLEIENTTPGDVYKVISSSKDDLDVYINSQGGEIASGSEIYTMIREAAQNRAVLIHITGAAHSAASVIACAARSVMAPTALMMVHCVSSWAVGNHNDLEKEAETLKTADQALSGAYTAKTGMTQEEVIDLMEHETWLTAERAKELGFVDEVMFEDENREPLRAASGSGLLSVSEVERIREMLNKDKAAAPQYTDEEIAQARLLHKGRVAVCRIPSTDRTCS
jgi:ATP-dependent protease ClpP protease subunit